MKEIDAFIDSEDREEMGHEEHLKKLLELNDKAALIHHPVAKVKRQKLLKQEITKTRRKLSMDKAGTTPKRTASTAAAPGQAGGNADEHNPTPKTKGKYKKNREVSPLDGPEDGASDAPQSGRRLRAAGKEDKAAAATPASATGGGSSARSTRNSDLFLTNVSLDLSIAGQVSAGSKGKGRKRQRAPSSESEVGKKARSDDAPAAKTPVKASSAGATSSPAKSPAGVNRYFNPCLRKSISPSGVHNLVC